MFYVYIVKTSNNQHYVGYTTDLRKRIKDHKSGKTKYLKDKLPIKLVYYEAYLTDNQARKREIELKKNWSEKEKILNRIKKTAPSSSG